MSVLLLPLLAACVDDPTASALPRDDWGERPTAPLPASLGLSTTATTLARGGRATFTVTLPDDAEAGVYLVFADGKDEPVCPAPLDGACLDVHGGWLVFGPFTPEEGRVDFELELPLTFHGDRLVAQAVVRSPEPGGAPRVSGLVHLDVTGPMDVTEADLAPLAETFEAAPVHSVGFGLAAPEPAR